MKNIIILQRNDVNNIKQNYGERMTVKLIHGDCLQVMPELIEEGIKVDLVLTDLPYGTTANKWDTILPLNKMWEQLIELTSISSVIVLFSNQPFTSKLIMSNLEDYGYSWVWNKGSASNFLNCNYAPLKITEDINVFSKSKVGSLSKNPIKYSPQGVEVINKMKKNNPNSNYRKTMGYNTNNNQLNNGEVYFQKYTEYPNNILKYPKDKSNYHPTQKPVELLEYLIKTYTNEKDTVLDFTMGSGSTGVACLQTNRNFIGIELEEKYYNIAKERCSEYQSKLW